MASFFPVQVSLKIGFLTLEELKWVYIFLEYKFRVPARAQAGS